MTLGRILKKLAPSDVRNYVSGIQGRIGTLEAQLPAVTNLQSTITALEATLDTAIYSPRYVAADDVGFNSQMQRKAIFTDLLEHFPFDNIVETGTWTGNTTGYMAQKSRLPVFSGELNHRFHTIAGMRLVDFPGITLRNADSRKFLSDLAENPDLTGSFTFFYLDAHWYADLPLAEELDLIASRWSRFVVMVDDFQVPGDEGYGYDDYGAGKALTIEYIKPVIARRNLTAWFPAAPAESESGHKRGCVVIAPAGNLTEALASIRSVRS